MKKDPRLLLIDDSKEIAAALSAAMKAEGIELNVVTDGVAGIEAAKHQKPDLILLDLMLPKLSGFDVCKILKTDNLTWRIPIVIISTVSKPELIDRAKEAGADHFIRKPYSLEETVKQIKALIP